jgi:hypothetical protein
VLQYTILFPKLQELHIVRHANQSREVFDSIFEKCATASSSFQDLDIGIYSYNLVPQLNNSKKKSIYHLLNQDHLSRNSMDILLFIMIIPCYIS